MQQRNPIEFKKEINAEDKFLRNLQTALRHTLVTCVLRTGNRFADYEKTGGWNFFQRYRYHKPGHYRKFPPQALRYKIANRILSSQKIAN